MTVIPIREASYWVWTLVNALRAVLYEYGQVIRQGIVHIKRIDAMIESVMPDHN